MSFDIVWFLIVLGGFFFILIPAMIIAECKDRSGDTFGYQNRKDQKRPSREQLDQLSETIQELYTAINRNSLPGKALVLQDKIDVLRAKRMQLREIDDGVNEEDQMNLFAKQKRRETLELKLNQMADDALHSADKLVSE